MRTIVLLTLISLSGCASRPPVIQEGGTPPRLAKEQPPPPAGMFDRCLTEILAYGLGKGQISQACSDALQLEQTP